MGERRMVPAAETRVEIKVSNSRFIATAAPVFSVDEAKEFVTRIRNEFRDASHNVPAYIIGHGPSTIAHCHDDGEPSGTAGRPILAVLQGSGLGNVAVVVTRYFGGTKLGTGGLVRAYGDAVKEVLSVLPRAEMITTSRIMISTSYALLAQLRQLIDRSDGLILEEAFAADITMLVQLRDEDIPEFQKRLDDLSQGQAGSIVVESNITTIRP